MTHSFMGYQCWEQALISRVINREAIETDAAIFMATHAPMSQIIYERAPYQVRDTSEEGLFAEIVGRAREDQHTFIVLKGIPGTGKSHLIRWLYERFRTHQQEQQDETEVTRLISRANSSLSNTLLQIIESGLFDSSRFRGQIERLRSAASNLTEQALGNRILNGLQEAARAVQADEHTPLFMPSSKRIVAFSPNFLLDPAIRDFLQRPGKAVDRIALFLSGAGRTSSLGEEMPGFQADDFIFPASEVQRSVSNPVALKMVNSLLSSEEVRDELSAYFNGLLNYAVEWLTSITVDELKRMFGELRRSLRTQQKSLVLFIEDITAFTGLDAALIDVLATQHGGGNADFCRLISIVGITDSYFHDRFPDNMRERVTFQLALNASNSDHTPFLNSPARIADISARYLNAIRLPPRAIQDWYTHGAVPTELPNRCFECSFRSQCHTAFGHVSLDGSGNERFHIGLYPFNENALWMMYQQIDTRKTTRTPRSLLNSILAYVLQSHGLKISQRQFPPPPGDLGSDFAPPTMPKPQQRRIIQNRAGSPARAERIESLLLFWGNRTLDAVESQGQTYVGGLSKTVFDSFDLPFIIEGVVEPISESPAPKPEPPGPEPGLPLPLQKTTNVYAADIARWARGGMLENYEVLSRQVVNFVKNAIDWEMRGISQTQVDDRVRQVRFVIEGQSGRAIAQPRLWLARSPELEQLLYAAADVLLGDLSPGKLGAHLATINTWLLRHEAEILAFVRQPNETIPDEPLPLTHLLTIDVLLLAALTGDLVTSETSPRELFKRIVRTVSSKTFNPNYISFGRSTDLAQGRTQAWLALMRKLQNAADDVREQFLIALNCSQGASREVIFVNAVLALEALESFVKDWQLPAYTLPAKEASKDRRGLWENASLVYRETQGSLVSAVEQEAQEIATLRLNLLAILGDEPLDSVWKALESFLVYTQTEVKVNMPPIPESLTRRKLQARLTEIEKLDALESFRDRIMWLSGHLDLKRETQVYLDYLEQLRNKLDALDVQLAQESREPEIAALEQKVAEVRALYIQLETWLYTLGGDMSREEI